MRKSTLIRQEDYAKPIFIIPNENLCLSDIPKPEKNPPKKSSPAYIERVSSVQNIHPEPSHRVY